MPRAPKKVVSLPWPELDKIELTAGWINRTDPVRLAVNRLHDGILRGRWEFEYTKKNEWECTRAGPQYLRVGPFIKRRVNELLAKASARDTDESRIPQDIELKAREFLAAELKLRAKKVARKSS